MRKIGGMMLRPEGSVRKTVSLGRLYKCDEGYDFRAMPVESLCGDYFALE